MAFVVFISAPDEIPALPKGNAKEGRNSKYLAASMP